jgi:predicted RND superfamily exporter protein
MIKARFVVKRHLVSHHFAYFVVNKSRYLLFSFILLTLVSITAIIFYIPNSLEYDFSKLKTKSSLPKWEASLSTRITNLFGITITPAIILVNKPDEADEICNVIMKNQGKLDEKEKTIDKCKTLASHLPSSQDEKLVILKELKKTLQRNVLKLVNPEYQKELEKFKKEVNLKKLTINDLPISIKRNFQELDETIGTIVFVYPRANANLWYGKNLIKFAESIRENKLSTGETIHSSSEQVIFADILRAMMHDGPKASFLALLFVIIIILFISRGFKHAKFIISTLVIGIILMAGIMAIFNLKINYFNIVAFPITIGIGIDYAVNLYQRYKHEGFAATNHVLTTTGGAVVTCSLTTIVSYFVLLFAKNQALKSFGLVAIIGELTCLAAAMMLLPSIIMFFNKK